MKFELEPHNRNVPDDELITDLKRVANELQKNSVSVGEYGTRGRFHPDTLYKRFGSWFKAVEKAGLVKSPRNITGRSPATDPSVILEVDHIVPWDKDGETVMENLQTLAKEINIGKSNLDMYQ